MAYDFGYLDGYGIVDPSLLVWARSIPSTPATWTFAAGPWTGLPTTDLSEATSRTVTWRLTGSSEASLTMPGLSSQTVTLQEMVSDLWVMRNGLPLFRGRFGSSNETADEDSQTVQFGCADYRELLHRRILYDSMTRSYTSTDQSAIAWGLISSTQAAIGGGGNLGIIRGVGSTTGIVRSQVDFQAGDIIGDRLDSQSQVDDGYDFDINPVPGSTALTFDLYYPQRGSTQNVVLDYGGRVSGYSCSFDPATFGNAARGTGADTLSPITINGPGLATDPAGRWDLQFADSAITNGVTLQGKTYQTVLVGQSAQPAWTVTLAPNTWGGPTDFWLGDTVTLAVRTGRHDVVQPLRVHEIGLALDSEGTETITVTLGAPDPTLKRRIPSLVRRLSALERR